MLLWLSMVTKSQAKKTALTQATADNAAEMAEQATENLVYEVAFHALPVLSEEKLADVVDGIRALLVKNHAEIISEKVPEKITLAYRVERSIAGKREKYSESYFGYLKFSVAPQTLSILEAYLRDTYEVLRSIVVETSRADSVVKKRAVFSSTRLEGTTIAKSVKIEDALPEEVKPVSVSEEELDKSIDALIA